MDELELVGVLALAAVLGATLGLERESRGKSAGLRTHALVSVGAALFTIAGSQGFGGSGGRIDPTRVAAQVATGIGFIGAGAILRTGASISGLTTAATLWLAAAIGVTVAAGLYVTSIGATAVVVVIVVPARVLKRFFVSQHQRTVRVEYRRGHGTLGPLLRGLQALGSEIAGVHIDDERPDGARRVDIDLLTTDDVGLDRVVDAIGARPEVRYAQWRSPAKRR